LLSVGCLRRDECKKLRDNSRVRNLHGKKDQIINTTSRGSMFVIVKFCFIDPHLCTKFLLFKRIDYNKMFRLSEKKILPEDILAHITLLFFLVNHRRQTQDLTTTRILNQFPTPFIVLLHENYSTNAPKVVSRAAFAAT